MREVKVETLKNLCDNNGIFQSWEVIQQKCNLPNVRQAFKKLVAS